MPQSVNGVLCYNCSDVARAKTAERLGVSVSQVSMPSGELKAKFEMSPNEIRDVNKPLENGDKGRSINILT